MSTKFFSSYDFNSINKMNNFIHSTSLSYVTEATLRDLLCTEKVKFVLNGINRLQSTLLCELGLSYVQQSQRYVPIKEDSIRVLNNTPDEIYNSFKSLTDRSMNLYHEMTELTYPEKKGRLTESDFKHGIMYEDARSILPLCIKTNMTVATSADKMIDLFGLFHKYPLIFVDLKKELSEILPDVIYRTLNAVSTHRCEINKTLTNKYYRDYFNRINCQDNVVCFEMGMLDEDIVIGALASQNEQSPDVIYDSWNSEEVKYKTDRLIDRVLGYGHNGILEQGITKFGMQCSLSTYHQAIRHRLQNIKRESFIDIIGDVERPYIIPDSILNNETFYNKVIELISDYKIFYKELYKKYDKIFLSQYLLNCAPVKFIVSSNIRHDTWIFRERLCLTAQSEIRDMYLKKFDILYESFPNLVKDGLPPCIIGKGCKESGMTCSKVSEAKKVYAKYCE